ncbi:MAG: polyprenyl diphosphate synthase [Vampirovibrionales bacterium]
MFSPTSTSQALPTRSAHAGMPQHVAIIMDGNRRWAKQRHLPSLVGHQQGVQALKRTVTHALSLNIAVLTVYAFSTENWQRPAEELAGLMDVLGEAMVNELEPLARQGVRVQFLGDLTAFSHKLQALMSQLAQTTQHNTQLILQVALNYGGRAELIHALNRWQQEHPGQALTEALLSEQLSPLPEPDLLIRTGGEQRLSNFLLWQLAYSELYFTPTLWPDFGPDRLDEALSHFIQRQRRFGK